MVRMLIISIETFAAVQVLHGQPTERLDSGSPHAAQLSDLWHSLISHRNGARKRL
jgi:hypothetical protein